MGRRCNRNIFFGKAALSLTLDLAAPSWITNLRREPAHNLRVRHLSLMLHGELSPACNAIARTTYSVAPHSVTRLSLSLSLWSGRSRGMYSNATDGRTEASSFVCQPCAEFAAFSLAPGLAHSLGLARSLIRSSGCPLDRPADLLHSGDKKNGFYICM